MGDFDTVLDQVRIFISLSAEFSFNSTHQENRVSAQLDVRNRSKFVPRD